MTREPKIAVALPDSKPWGITRFFNGVNEYARAHHWRLTSCPVNPESAEAFPLEWSRLKSWRVDGIIVEVNRLVDVYNTFRASSRSTEVKTESRQFGNTLEQFKEAQALLGQAQGQLEKE